MAHCPAILDGYVAVSIPDQIQGSGNHGSLFILKGWDGKEGKLSIGRGKLPKPHFHISNAGPADARLKKKTFKRMPEIKVPCL